MLDAGGRDQRRVVPQAQAIGQVVSGHGREGHARRQGTQPCQALHGLDVDHQADRAAFAQSRAAPLQPGPGSLVVADDRERPQAGRFDHAPRDGAGRELGAAHRQHRGFVRWRGGNPGRRDGWPGRRVGARLEVQGLVVRQRRRAAMVLDHDQRLAGTRGQRQACQQHEQDRECEMGRMGFRHGEVSWRAARTAAVGRAPCTRARWRDTLRR